MFRFTRKQLAAGLAVLLTAVHLTSPAAAVTVQQEPADLNGDGVVDVFDFVLSKRAIVSETAPVSLCLSDAEGRPGETVCISVAVENNPGFQWMATGVTFGGLIPLDAQGEPMAAGVFNDEPLLNAEIWGAAAYLSDDSSFIGIVASAGNEYKIEGDVELISLYFQIPADAEPGTVYTLIPDQPSFWEQPEFVSMEMMPVLTQRGHVRVCSGSLLGSDITPPETTADTTETTTSTSATTTTTTTTTTTATTTTIATTTATTTTTATAASVSKTVTTTKPLVLPSQAGVLKRGIDISRFQGNVDFKKVANDPHGQFAILRAGYGKYAKQIDSMFYTYYNNAKAAGVPVGAYWYSYAMSADEARIEANACAQVLGNRKFEYPIAFDIEDPSQQQAVLNGTLSKEEFSEIVDAFCSEMEKKGYYVVIYTNPCFRSYMTDSMVKKYDIWVANWRVTKPNIKESYGIWQFGSTKMNVGTNSVSGVNCECDLDLAYRDYPAIMQQKHRNGY